MIYTISITTLCYMKHQKNQQKHVVQHLCTLKYESIHFHVLNNSNILTRQKFMKASLIAMKSKVRCKARKFEYTDRKGPFFMFPCQIKWKV